MRLREIQSIMNNNLTIISKSLKASQQSDGFFYVENYDELLKAIYNISKTSLIGTELRELEQKNLLLFSEQKKVKFSKERYKELSNILTTIQIRILTIDELVSYSYETDDEQPDSLIVSFPDRELSLKEMAEITESLNKTFKILNSFEPFDINKIKIQDFDIGTNWMVIVLGIPAAVKVFGDIVFTVQRAKLNGLTNKFLEKQLELTEMDEMDKQKFKSQAREIALATYRKLSDKIIEDNNLDNSSELTSQMAKVLEQVNTLNEQDVGFTAGINSAIEASKAFPSLNQQKSLNVLKQLESLSQLPSNDENKE